MKDPHPHLVMNGVVLPFPGHRARASWLHVALRAFAAPADWLRIERDIRRLSRMDDRLLRDIGITRSDISRSVREGRE